MKVVWVKGYKCIDNGVFLDGRDKTLEEAGVQSAWKGRKEEDRPKRVVKSGESNKVERLKRAAKGAKSINMGLNPT